VGVFFAAIAATAQPPGFHPMTDQYGHMGIGTIAPDKSAILDLSTTTAGFLMPRLTNAERNAIANPATGLMIFNTNSKTIEFNIGTAFAPIWDTVLAKAALAGVCWDTQGNAGTNPATDFLGTTDAQPLVLRVNNLTGARLQAYLAAGIDSDHEITAAEDAMEKLRSGMTVELRGSHDYVLPGVVEAINKLPAIPQTLTVCTDDIFPDYLVDKGGVGDTLRRLIRYGLDPLQAYRCATLNSAMRLERRDLGLVAAGRRADLIVLSDLRAVTVDDVYAQGRLVSRDGRLVEPVTRAIGRWPAPDALAERMRAAGFVSVDVRLLAFGIAAAHVARKGAS